MPGNMQATALLISFIPTTAPTGLCGQGSLNAQTAELVDLPYDADLDFEQYQGFLVDGDEVYLAVTPTGKDGNLYILNSKTGDVTKGATLVKEAGNHYIGIF